ncbi:MAG: hypothetical protein R2853_09310 [Thermomicrobiales bacterium]
MAAVRARVGLVTQESYLFGASLRDNLTLFDDRVPDTRLVDVLDDLGMGPWLRELPDGGDDARRGRRGLWPGRSAGHGVRPSAAGSRTW